jgi:hypothetical protein
MAKVNSEQFPFMYSGSRIFVFGFNHTYNPGVSTVIINNYKGRQADLYI